MLKLSGTHTQKDTQVFKKSFRGAMEVVRVTQVHHNHINRIKIRELHLLKLGKREVNHNILVMFFFFTVSRLFMD